jgi:hypothetical protein
MFQRERRMQVMDQKSRSEYRKRILELQEDIREFDERNDFENLKKCQQEYDYLLDFLSKSMEMGGKTRKFNDAADKARSAVTWRIRDAIKRIAKAHPKLGSHLQRSVTTGQACSYDPESEIDWKLS